LKQQDKILMKKPVKMAWNEPGGSKKDDDPWGEGKNNQQGPPDLDEVVRNIQEKVAGIFGGKKKGSGTGGSNRMPGNFGIGIIILIIIAVWALSGFYIVDEGKRGVVLEFGKYKETTQSGLRWHIPYPVESVQIVNVSQIRNVEIGYRSGGGEQATRSIPREALMLTQDENIVDVNFAIQYRVKDAKDYLFNVRDPDVTLGAATESAIREVIGKSKMDFVLTEGRSDVAARVEALIQQILDLYNSGLHVTSVNMQDAQPPEQVQAAFSDAVKAREDLQRSKNEAEAYANDVEPRARGTKAQVVAEAEAYKQKVVIQAKGDASRFLQVLTEYEKAPQVTRERLYLETIEEVLKKTSKVMLDVKGGGNILFLPLDRLLQGSNMPFSTGTSQSSAGQSSGSSSTQQSDQRSSNSTGQADDQRSRLLLRSREIR
jgi:modulator of FtsH protease HflK